MGTPSNDSLKTSFDPETGNVSLTFHLDDPRLSKTAKSYVVYTSGGYQQGTNTGMKKGVEGFAGKKKIMSEFIQISINSIISKADILGTQEETTE